jgi:hypothetical protein
MADILHRVGIKSSSLNDAYKALSTREGLSAWWTNNTQGCGRATVRFTEIPLGATSHCSSPMRWASRT